MIKTVKGTFIPINRAEGDLEIRVEVADGRVIDAWSAGTMYRGFEQMMQGRGALDGLVVTPRVCGICSITHLAAAAEALDQITGIEPPDNARRLRNLALMVETVQSDIRQAILMFMVDFASRGAYEDHSLFAEAQRRYDPLKGRAAIEVIRETKRLLQIVAIVGGQWPHTSFMVPGGVTSMPEVSKLLQCRIIYQRFLSWYERTILGCSVERWKQLKTDDDLQAWLDENSSHRESEVGFYIRFAKEAGLDCVGKGVNRFLSYGNYTLPETTQLTGRDGRLLRSGFAVGTDVTPFSATEITEDISHSWYEAGTEPLHPSIGESKPYASGQGTRNYSWIKAPRYRGEPVETGPLAEMVIDELPLFQNMVDTNGPSVFVRELARMVRPAYRLSCMTTWIEELLNHNRDKFYKPFGRIPDGEGAGLIQAARGALGHWVRIEDEKITNYQIITPSSWNGSPRDVNGLRGPWEEALIGTPVKDINNPVEAGHVIRSFDPCLVCAVHSFTKGEKRGGVTISCTP
jgi:Ni,Fe-hydrogenase I large subunit